MSDFEFVGVHVNDGVGTLLLSRPPTNALTRQVCREITAAAADLSARDDVTAVIVFGGHETFCAGDDLPERGCLTAEESAVAVDVLRTAVDAVAAISTPTVAAVTGYALGGGLTLALAADWRISGDNAKFGATEILDGLVASDGASVRLSRAVGESRAKDLVFTGRFVDAREALAIGLIDEMVAPDHVYDAALRWAGRFAGSPRAALAAAKAAFASGR
ncbi:enoyl-CoA hydratase [Mycolicibacterium sp. GCM10028919]|uniref:enoyl-CoA hydratase n=1 Tax=Mycolicibacterium sp. GCM10028919 TaxID=3273401 RepID=UPI0036184E56